MAPRLCAVDARRRLAYNSHVMRRITGTTIYTYVACPRAAELDLHEDRSRRRPLTEAEELSRLRGRELEALRTAKLGYAEPRYAKNDYADGAQQTLALLRDGVAGVSQGVLADGDLLGIPDLVRKEPGASAFGDFHYVVGDVKSSRRPRTDQLLQVAFYARLLAAIQGRMPEYGYLVMRDGREERFRLADYGDAIDEVDARVAALLDPARAARERPFLAAPCSGCTWSEHCSKELHERADLSLLQRMTRGLRDTLETAGIRDCHAAAVMAIETTARRTHLEAALLRRIKRAAESWLAREPLTEPRGRQNPLPDHALVSIVVDGFEERALCFGVLVPGAGEPLLVEPHSRGEELGAFLGLVARVPEHLALAHHGLALPRWFAEASRQQSGAHALERRFLDLSPRFRGAATYPRPIFELADYVRAALGREPARIGQAVHEGSEGLAERGREELQDLAALVGRLMR